MLSDFPFDGLLGAMAAVEHDFADDLGASRVEVIAACDRLIRHVQAIQLEQIAEFYDDRAEHSRAVADGDPALHVIGQVSLARNISPGAAGSQFGLASRLAELPQVAAAFKNGVISEPTVRAISRHSAGLALDDLVVFDAEIATHLPGLTPGRAATVAEAIAISLDPDLAARHAQERRDDVRVTLRPLPDGVAMLTVEAPAEQLTAVHKALETWALGLRSAGDERKVETIMAETLVERVLGANHASDTTVEVGIVIDLATLLRAEGHPVELVGHGPIAPAIADDIIGNAHKTFYRRLITDPITGTLVARDERRRLFDKGLAGFIRSRDRHRCRQPGCDCRIRDIDHIKAYSTGGLTRTDNGEGLCRRSHIFKHLPDWQVTSDSDGTITWKTPSGHTYKSPTPSLNPAAA